MGERLNALWDKYVSGKSAGWTAGFTLVLTLTTIILAYIAYQTNESNKISQRAFVSFAGTTGTKISVGDAVTGVQFFVIWQNGGNTPTRTALTHANWQPWSPELPTNFDFPDIPDLETRPFVVGPKAATTVPMVMPISAFIDAKEGRKRLFIWGWTTYRDVFKGSPPRVTEFCSEVVNINSTKPSMTDQSGDISWQTTTCKVHNCYDEDCPDYKQRIEKTN